MNKSCPACGGPISDPQSDFCPSCAKLELPRGGLTRAELEALAELTSKRLKADWRFNVRIVVLMIITALAVVGFLDAIIGFNLKDSMTAHFRAQEAAVTNRIGEHLTELDKDVKTALAQTDSQMRSNIARSFQAPAIQASIQEVGKAQAKKILEAEVRPAVESFREDAAFIRTVARAQAYDFKSYQELLMSASQTNKNSDLARQALSEINRSLERLRSEPAPKRVFMTVSGTNLYQGPFTSDELAMWFSQASQDPISLNREGFVNSIRELRQPLFLSSLIQLLTNETDLAVGDRLASAISDLAKQEFKPHDFQRILTWWNEHRDTYTNWPFSTLERGMKEFSSVRYPQAAEALEQVIKLDGQADMSRAYVIACYCETGDTNRVAVLARGFKNPSGRWAQWARAKADLESGNVSNATVSFFQISTNFPTMGTAPNPTSHVYRNIDWQVFNHLKGTNSALK